MMTIFQPGDYKHFKFDLNREETHGSFAEEEEGRKKKIKTHKLPQKEGISRYALDFGNLTQNN